MVIASISGGLGNQMFQYAMARRLACRHGVELALDLSNYGLNGDVRPRGLERFQRRFRLDAFRIVATVATEENLVRLRDPYSIRSLRASIIWRVRRLAPGFLVPGTHVREKQYRFDSKILHLPPDVYVQGYWQSERYFEDIESLIRYELTPRDSGIVQYASEYVAKLRSIGGPIVSLHVRRGDLAEAYKLKRLDLVAGPPVGPDYIEAAMRRFPEPCRFLVFSDSSADVEWCKRNIHSNRLHFSEAHSDVQDLALMSACDHHIIANSTFSWWAAWLDSKPGRRVLAPCEWSPPHGGFRVVVDDLIPADWEIL